MATNLSLTKLRESLRSGDFSSDQSFDILRGIAHLVANPDQRVVAQELVLRAMEHRIRFEPYTEVLDSLIRSVGLFPYLDPDALGLRDTLAYEFHRPDNMGEDFVFHREQAEIYMRLLNGDSVILSAPTSFGKSKIIDAIIAAGKFNNIAVIVPTLALIDETRRRLAKFSESYKIITHLSQKPADSNIFVLTAERAVAYEEFPAIDFFVIDEFYKLGAMNQDQTRTVALNQAFYKLRKNGGQFYLLGPSIQNIPDGIESAFRCYFYPTKFATVVSEQITVPGKGHEIERLLSLCKTIQDPTLIFCRSPARVNEVAHALLEAGIGEDAPELRMAAEWTGQNFHPDWIFGQSLLRGIGIHHGKLPRSLAQYVVRQFNNLNLKFLICTSTLIEGVNTKAKNVIIFDNKIAKQSIDFFTFNNIKGRSGRMFEHFVGHVYLFNEPPAEQLPFVDFPLFSQGQTVPENLLLQMESEDLEPVSVRRLQAFHDQNILPISVLRENASIDPSSQIRLAQKLKEAPVQWSRSLCWTGFPTSDQLKVVCDLIWDFLLDARNRGGVRSAAQLKFKIWQMWKTQITKDRILLELQPGEYAAKSPDEAVEKVLEFERTWASFEFPRYLTTIDKIQRAIFEPLGLPCGNYSTFISQVECFFHTPVIAALDEYGIPIEVGGKIAHLLGSEDDLDVAIDHLKSLRPERLRLSSFEKSLIADAQEGL